MEIKQVIIDKLKPYKLNSKKHPQSQLEGIAESIRRFGFKQPIVIDDNFTIICGHGRVEAAKLVGLNEIPCVVADDLSENEIKAFRIIDNKIAESGYDNELLKIELEEIDYNFEPFNIDLEIAAYEGDVAESPVKEDKDEFTIVVDCKNETAQQKLYEELTLREFKCKLMM